MSVCPKHWCSCAKICRNVYGPRYILQALTGCHAIIVDGHDPAQSVVRPVSVCVWLRDQRGCAENISGLVSGWLDRSQREDTPNYVLRFMTMSQTQVGFKGFFNLRGVEPFPPPPPKKVNNRIITPVESIFHRVGGHMTRQTNQKSRVLTLISHSTS